MKRPALVLYDDSRARAMEPYALTRPFGEVRAGALLIRERWERVFGTSAAGFIAAPHLATYDAFGAPAAQAKDLPAGTIVVTSRFAPAIAGQATDLAPGESLGSADGQVVAVALASGLSLRTLADGSATLASLAEGRARTLDGWWLNQGWDLIRHLPAMLGADARVLADAIADEPPAHVAVLGEHRLAVERGAYLEPHVVADTRNGDVVVLADARIAAFTRLAGPCVIGPHTEVHGGGITACSIGPHARVSGEMSVTIVAGYANKAHDGFVGHSVIGYWANLGAGTTTSNLKNTYGEIRVRDGRGDHATGMQFLGSLVGDHAKTAIGTRLTTGTIIGAGASVLGDRSPDKYVTPFAWGDGDGRYRLEKFLDTAARVMERRNVILSRGMRDVLSRAWTTSASPAPSLKSPKAAKAAKPAKAAKAGKRTKAVKPRRR